MYYNGNVFSLWSYLAELLYRSHPNEVFTSSIISISPHLAYLLLRFIECGTFIRDNTTNEVKRSVSLRSTIRNLGNIIEATGVSSELKSRAMAMRLLEQYLWRQNEVIEIFDGPIKEQAKNHLLDESQKAIAIAKGVSDHSCVLEYMARLQVEYGTIKIQAPTWRQLLAQENLFNRDDLYGTCWFLAYGTKHAIDFRDRQALEKIIPVIKTAKTLILGEWDQILCRQLGKLETSPFYRECEGTSKSNIAQEPETIVIPKLISVADNTTETNRTGTNG